MWSSLAQHCKGTGRRRDERPGPPDGQAAALNLQRHVVRVHVERLTCAKQRLLRLAGSARPPARPHAHVLLCAQDKRASRALTASDDMHAVDAAEKSRDGRVEARDKLQSPTR